MSQIALRCSIGFSPVTHSYKYLLLLTSLLTRLLILVSFTAINECPVTSTQAYSHKSHHLWSCTFKRILFSFLFSYVDKYILKPSFSFLSKVISSDTALLSPLTDDNQKEKDDGRRWQWSTATATAKLRKQRRRRAATKRQQRWKRSTEMTKIGSSDGDRNNDRQQRRPSSDGDRKDDRQQRWPDSNDEDRQQRQQRRARLRQR